MPGTSSKASTNCLGPYHFQFALARWSLGSSKRLARISHFVPMVAPAHFAHSSAPDLDWRATSVLYRKLSQGPVESTLSQHYSLACRTLPDALHLRLRLQAEEVRENQHGAYRPSESNSRSCDFKASDPRCAATRRERDRSCRTNRGQSFFLKFRVPNDWHPQYTEERARDELWEQPNQAYGYCDVPLSIYLFRSQTPADAESGSNADGLRDLPVLRCTNIQRKIDFYV